MHGPARCPEIPRLGTATKPFSPHSEHEFLAEISPPPHVTGKERRGSKTPLFVACDTSGFAAFHNRRVTGQKCSSQQQTRTELALPRLRLPLDQLLWADCFSAGNVPVQQAAQLCWKPGCVMPWVQHSRSGAGCPPPARR